MPRNNVHVKKGDTVVVITGKYAGKKGKVLQVFPLTQRVIVEGVNVVKRHTRATRKLPQGGIVEKEAPIASSNVMIVCLKCNQPTRIGKKLVGQENHRFCKQCGELLDK